MLATESHSISLAQRAQLHNLFKLCVYPLIEAARR